jgi:hypothetical protein
MTFAQVHDFVATNLAPDGDFHPAPASSGTLFDSAFGIRLALYLRLFTRDARLLWTSATPITVEDGDHEFSFADPAKSTLELWDVHKVWLRNEAIYRFHSVEALLHGWGPATPAGTPRAWAQLDDRKIVFDVEVASDIDDCYASGYYLHPAITADAQTVLLLDEHVPLFDRYAQAYFRENVAADSLGVERLAAIDQQAYEAITELRGAAIARHLRREGW